MFCSKMLECGKSEQNLASYYCGLVVKLVVKRGWVTTKDYIIHYTYFEQAYILSLIHLIFYNRIHLNLYTD